jgi:hypothetical protein
MALANTIPETMESSNLTLREISKSASQLGFTSIMSIPAIKIQQWIVIRPCDLVNGRKDSLPAVGLEPLSIVVLPKGDQRLRSLNKDYSILGCTIEEAASQFKPTARPGEPNRSALFGGGSSLVTSNVPISASL